MPEEPAVTIELGVIAPTTERAIPTEYEAAMRAALGDAADIMDHPESRALLAVIQHVTIGEDGFLYLEAESIPENLHGFIHAINQMRLSPREADDIREHGLIAPRLIRGLLSSPREHLYGIDANREWYIFRNFPDSRMHLLFAAHLVVMMRDVSLGALQREFAAFTSLHVIAPIVRRYELPQLLEHVQDSAFLILDPAGYEQALELWNREYGRRYEQWELDVLAQIIRCDFARALGMDPDDIMIVIRQKSLLSSALKFATKGKLEDGIGLFMIPKDDALTARLEQLSPTLDVNLLEPLLMNVDRYRTIRLDNMFKDAKAHNANYKAFNCKYATESLIFFPKGREIVFEVRVIPWELQFARNQGDHSAAKVLQARRKLGVEADHNYWLGFYAQKLLADLRGEQTFDFSELHDTVQGIDTLLGVDSHVLLNTGRGTHTFFVPNAIDQPVWDVLGQYADKLFKGLSHLASGYLVERTVLGPDGTYQVKKYRFQRDKNSAPEYEVAPGTWVPYKEAFQLQHFDKVLALEHFAGEWQPFTTINDFLNRLAMPEVPEGVDELMRQIIHRYPVLEEYPHNMRPFATELGLEFLWDIRLRLMTLNTRVIGDPERLKQHEVLLREVRRRAIRIENLIGGNILTLTKGHARVIREVIAKGKSIGLVGILEMGCNPDMLKTLFPISPTINGDQAVAWVEGVRVLLVGGGGGFKQAAISYLRSVFPDGKYDEGAKSIFRKAGIWVEAQTA